ncbi:MAG: hypothetical protein GY816_18510 [Cytophagales bacterium]|nr:hypothetical protein [Cytophagales bacterium]
MNTRNLRNLVTYTISIAILVACGGNSDKGNSNSDEFKKAQDDLKENVKKVLYEIPSPAEIPFLLQATGVDFDATLINSIDKVDSYASLTDKAILNLGIYATDVGYLSSYEKTQESLTYMRSCRKLADNLGLSDSFSPELIGRFEKSVESRDSLATLVNETIADAENLLKEDSRENLAALMITGSFIEGIYLGTQIVDNYPDDLDETTKNLILSKLIRMIIDQKEPLEDLVTMLKSTEQTDRVTSILAGLSKVTEAYNGVDLEALIANQETLSAETIKAITDAVAPLRNDLIS